MNELLITVVHATARVKPSAAFPEGWRESARACFERADNPDAIQYITVVHESRWDDLFGEDQQKLGHFGAWGTHKEGNEDIPNHSIVKNTGRDCCVDQANAALPGVKGKLIYIAQDDMFPPQGWDTLLLEAIERRAIRDGRTISATLDQDLVLHVSSGMQMPGGEWNLPVRNDELFNPQILTKARADRLGYLGYPEYISAFCDDEFSEHARHDGVVIDARHIVFEHRHPIFGGAIDAVYCNENAAAAYHVGHELLLRRRAAGFPGLNQDLDEALSRCVLKGRAALPKLVCCLPGESHSWRWSAAWDGLRCALSGLFDIQPMFGCSSNLPALRNGMMEQSVNAGADLVLCLDDDNLLTPQQFVIMYEDLRAHKGIGLVAAWCWVAMDGGPAQGPITSCGFADKDWVVTPIDYVEMMRGEGDLIDLDYTGFPAVLIPRATLEKLGANPFTPFLGPQWKYGMSGEDTAFCRRVKEAGLKVVVDRRLKTPHLKLQEAEPVGLPDVKPPSLLKRVASKVMELVKA